MKSLEHIFNKHRPWVAVVILAVFFMAGYILYKGIAANPPAPLAPHETLDPDCMPSDSNCRVTGLWATNGDDIYNSNIGNVGINTANPGGLLDVLGLNGTQLKLDNYTINYFQTNGSFSVGDAIIGSTSGATGVILTDDGSKMTVSLDDPNILFEIGEEISSGLNTGDIFEFPSAITQTKIVSTTPDVSIWGLLGFNNGNGIGSWNYIDLTNSIGLEYGLGRPTFFGADTFIYVRGTAGTGFRLQSTGGGIIAEGGNGLHGGVGSINSSANISSITELGGGLVNYSEEKAAAADTRMGWYVRLQNQYGDFTLHTIHYTQTSGSFTSGVSQYGFGPPEDPNTITGTDSGATGVIDTDDGSMATVWVPLGNGIPSPQFEIGEEISDTGGNTAIIDSIDISDNFISVGPKFTGSSDSGIIAYSQLIGLGDVMGDLGGNSTVFTIDDRAGSDKFTFNKNVQIGDAGNAAGITMYEMSDWSLSESTEDIFWSAVTYGNGLFVAVGAPGGGDGGVMTSPDGITWTSRTAAADLDWDSIAYGNGTYVAVSNDDEADGVMTSPDSITWTLQTGFPLSWTSITFGGGLFVAVADDGSGDGVMTSPDGITWTSRTSAADNEWAGVTYGNGLFVAVSESGSGNRVMTSPDGITWTSRSSAADLVWHAVTYGNGLFVAVSRSGLGNRVMTSPDGITWTSRTTPILAGDNPTNTGVAFGDDLFVAVNHSVDGHRVMTSPDGITWTYQLTPADNHWNAVAFGDGTFVSVAHDGFPNEVMFLGPNPVHSAYCVKIVGGSFTVAHAGVCP